MQKIIYIRGLWSHPCAVDWIKNNLEYSTDLSVELFDYHDLLVENTSDITYVKRIKEKFGDLYVDDPDDLVVIGHSHGGVISKIIADRYDLQKVVLVNPAFRPWGILRQVPNQFKSVMSNFNIGAGYHKHFVVKFDGEIEERTRYFADNFRFSKDLGRVIATGSMGLDSLKSLKSKLLLIQSMKDEFVSVRSSLSFYDSISSSKDIMTIPDGEHAILEEDGVYPKIYKKINDFIKTK